MLMFSLQSLFRAYGWKFIYRVALPHPLKTLEALWALRRLEVAGDVMDVSVNGMSSPDIKGPHALVGVGFCLKPISCPSGRFNHDCGCLESAGLACVTADCAECEIRKQAEGALKTGRSFYIMTSAQDILYDVLLPSLEGGRFTSGIFLICRYSFHPFAMGLMIAGIRGRLIAFSSGDCRDYRTWVQADIGIKEEQTVFSEEVRRHLEISHGTDAAISSSRFEKSGHIWTPLPR